MGKKILSSSKMSSPVQINNNNNNNNNASECERQSAMQQMPFPTHSLHHRRSTACILACMLSRILNIVLIAQLGHKEGLEKVAALAIFVGTTQFRVIASEHNQEAVNHFVIEPGADCSVRSDLRKQTSWPCCATTSSSSPCNHAV